MAGSRVRRLPLLVLVWLGACDRSEPAAAPPGPTPRPVAEPPARPTLETETERPVVETPTAAPRADVGQTPPPPRPTPQLHTDASGDQTSYRLALDLRPDDLLEPAAMMERELAYRYSDGGQFEIYVPAALLPVSTPGCPSGVIVRMPWTNPKARGAEAAMEGKRLLFVALEQLRAGAEAEHRVFLELGPYVEVSAEEPERVSLTRCTVFFRHAGETEAYIASLEG